MRAASRARGRIHRLHDDALGDRRVLFEERAELVVDDRFDDALDLGVAELGLGLAFELRVRDLDADDRGHALADVVAADRRVFQVLREVVGVGVGVDVRVSAERNPERCVPPSCVLMLLANENSCGL